MTDTAPAKADTGTPFKPPADEAKPKTEGVGDKLRAIVAPKPKEDRKPRQRRQRSALAKRENLAGGLATVYALAGTGFVYAGEGPTGRVMQLQAPAAGVKLNKVVARSDFLYGLLSPFLKPSNVELGEVFALPLLVYMCDHYPQLRPMLQPALMGQLIPVVKAAARERAKVEDELRELTELDDDLAQMLGDVMTEIFGGQDEGSQGGPAGGPSPEGPRGGPSGPVPITPTMHTDDDAG